MEAGVDIIMIEAGSTSGVDITMSDLVQEYIDLIVNRSSAWSQKAVQETADGKTVRTIWKRCFRDIEE